MSSVTKAPYSSLAYSTRTEDIVDSSINSVLTTTLLKSREEGDDVHSTLSIEDVARLTEPNKPCVIIEQATLVGSNVRPNSLFGNLKLMEKSERMLPHLPIHAKIFIYFHRFFTVTATARIILLFHSFFFALFYFVLFSQLSPTWTSFTKAV